MTLSDAVSKRKTAHRETRVLRQNQGPHANSIFITDNQWQTRKVPNSVPPETAVQHKYQIIQLSDCWGTDRVDFQRTSADPNCTTCLFCPAVRWKTPYGNIYNQIGLSLHRRPIEEPFVCSLSTSSPVYKWLWPCVFLWSMYSCYQKAPQAFVLTKLIERHWNMEDNLLKSLLSPNFS